MNFQHKVHDTMELGKLLYAATSPGHFRLKLNMFAALTVHILQSTQCGWWCHCLLWAQAAQGRVVCNLFFVLENIISDTSNNFAAGWLVHGSLLYYFFYHFCVWSKISIVKNYVFVHITIVIGLIHGLIYQGKVAFHICQNPDTWM